MHIAAFAGDRCQAWPRPQRRRSAIAGLAGGTRRCQAPPGAAGADQTSTPDIRVQRAACSAHRARSADLRAQRARPTHAARRRRAIRRTLEGTPAHRPKVRVKPVAPPERWPRASSRPRWPDDASTKYKNCRFNLSQPPSRHQRRTVGESSWRGQGRNSPEGRRGDTSQEDSPTGPAQTKPAGNQCEPSRPNAATRPVRHLDEPERRERSDQADTQRRGTHDASSRKETPPEIHATPPSAKIVPTTNGPRRAHRPHTRELS